MGKPVGYWTAQNMRALLERYALSRNLDPSLSESWNKITYKDINEIEVHYYNVLVSKLCY